MSLLNPTVGDVCDRMAVLVLKHRAALEAGKPHEHYEAEHDQLASWLAEWFLPGSPLPAEVGRISDSLAKVHERLWQVVERTAELERREHEGLTADERAELSRLCLQAYRLNRGRVRNKEEIDRLCGCYTGPEKVTT